MTLAGVVHDSTGRPLSAAEVRVGRTFGVTSADGRFVLRGLHADSLALLVRRIG